MHGVQRTALEANFLSGSADSNNLWLVNWRDWGLPYCSLYVIAADNNWPCKIGISTAPEKRVKSLQVSVWKPLHVSKCFWAVSVKEAKRLEMAIHRRLTEDCKWLHGEWFDMHPDQASDIVEFVSMVEGVEISNEIPSDEIREQMRMDADLSFDPKKRCDFLWGKIKSRAE